MLRWQRLPAPPPQLLLRAVLFQTQRGQHSPADWHRQATESEPMRWLLRGCQPSRSCWYAFRDRVADCLDELNRQVLHQAIEEELTPASRGAVDGTLVAANASRHKLLNEATLDKRAEQLQTATVADQQTATAVDQQAATAVDQQAATAVDQQAATAVDQQTATAVDQQAATADQQTAPGADQQAAAPPALPGWMAPTPVGRQRQQRRLEKAQTRMQAMQTRNDNKRASKRKGRDKVVLSLSDPEAALGLDKEKVFRPLYNVQVVDDLDSPFVLGYDVFAQPNDAGVLSTLLPRTKGLLGHALRTLLGDTSYAGGADLAVAKKEKVCLLAPLPRAGNQADKQIPKSQFVWLEAAQTYVCPQGHRLENEGSSEQKRSGTETVKLFRYRCPPAHCQGCPLSARCTPSPPAGRTISRGEHEELIEALRERLATAEAKELYRWRSRTVELVNADWKQHRKLRRFSGRGLKRARCQVALTVLAHNLVTLLAEEKKAAQKKAKDNAVNPPEGAT